VDKSGWQMYIRYLVASTNNAAAVSASRFRLTGTRRKKRLKRCSLYSHVHVSFIDGYKYLL
jgi:hypothetical protein